jgi:hypothetical protein
MMRDYSVNGLRTNRFIPGRRNPMDTHPPRQPWSPPEQIRLVGFMYMKASGAFTKIIINFAARSRCISAEFARMHVRVCARAYVCVRACMRVCDELDIYR